jgi:hypothetical protein
LASDAGTTGLTSFMAGLGVEAVVETGLEAVLGTVPFLGSGSSNSSADKHPNLSNKPDKPDLFFFFGADRVAGRAEVEVDFEAGVGLDDDAAGVVVFFSVVIAFFSPLVVSAATALLVVLVSTAFGGSTDPSAAASPALSSLTSAGMGRDCDTELEGCMGVLGVAGVTTNSGGPCDWALVDEEAIADASFGRVVVVGGVVVIVVLFVDLFQVVDGNGDKDRRLGKCCLLL